MYQLRIVIRTINLLPIYFLELFQIFNCHQLNHQFYKNPLFQPAFGVIEFENRNLLFMILRKFNPLDFISFANLNSQLD